MSFISISNTFNIYNINRDKFSNCFRKRNMVRLDQPVLTVNKTRRQIVMKADAWAAARQSIQIEQSAIGDVLASLDEASLSRAVAAVWPRRASSPAPAAPPALPR
jgi:hypothetical protein